MESIQKRTWTEISLDNIAHNYKAIRERLPEGCRFLSVVKTNAYGHGAERIARYVDELGSDYLAATNIDDALQMRSCGVKAPILIFGYTDPDFTHILIKNGITQEIDTLENARAFSEAAAKTGKKLTVHIKVDSGMGRLGFICHGGRDPLNEMLEIMTLPALEFEGIFTHFSVSGEHEDEYTSMQLNSFLSIIDRLEQETGSKFKIKHCANSGAVINYEEAYLDMVRPGLMLYGYYPDRYKGKFELRPAMELKTTIAGVKNIKPGDSVSYGRRFTADRPMKIAVLTIGYGDGLHRALSGKIDVLINGKRARQIGTICMDFCMADVTGIECKVGDTVTLFGKDGDEFIPIEEMAEKAGTISYELTCALTERVKRVYKGG